MMEQLQWLSLQERRARARLYMLHSIYHNTVAIPLRPLFMPSTHPMPKRITHVYFPPPVASTQAHERTFMIAAPTMWNGLEAQMTLIQSPDAFRSAMATVSLTA